MKAMLINTMLTIGVVTALGLLILSVAFFSKERGFHPLRRNARRFRELTWFEKLLFSAFVGVMTIFASIKDNPTNSPPANLPPVGLVGNSSSPLLCGSNNSGSIDCDRFTEIEVTTNGAALTLHRPITNALEAVEVTVAGSTNLVAATWEAYTNVVFATGVTNVEVFISREMMSAHSVSNVNFFAFIQSGDSDGDGLDDWNERFNLKTNPYSADSDGDGLPDGWEWVNGFDPNYAPDALEDADGDGVPNLYEFHHDTDPWQADAELVPKLVAGGTGANSVTNLAAAFSQAVPYSIVEVADGVHEGAGWSGLHLPAFPVVVTSSNGGRSRRATIRSTHDLSAFYLSATQTTHTVVQGLRIELAATSGRQYAFFIGGNLPFAGEPAAATFRNVTVRMPHPGVQYDAWFIRHHTTNRLVIAGCTVNAAGSTYAEGIYAVDSPPMSVENCSFVNFPPDAHGTTSVGILYESSSSNWGNAPSPIPVEIVNCLFDQSFTNAYTWAEIPSGVPYRVTMANCLMPAAMSEYVPEEVVGLVVTNSCTDWTGHLTADSPALGAGLPILYSSFDMDGEDWPNQSPIGADAYSPPVDDGLDTDGDGLSDFVERTVHGTDPYAADSDGDGANDGIEIEQGTDPCDVSSWNRTIVIVATNKTWTAGASNPTNYCGISQTEEGWNVDVSTSFTEHVASTSVVASTVAIYAKVFTDIDGNGVYDSGSDMLFVKPVPVRAMQAMNFELGDLDHDNIPDWWEVRYGLQQNGRADEYADPDHDGLINLHEFMLDTNPLVPDGSNTLLSVISRSVDDRLEGIDLTNGTSRFVNFFPNASNGVFVVNTNLWCRDVDLSCVSMWHEESDSYETRGTMTATAITRRHILLSHHWLSNQYRFCDANGNVVVRGYDSISCVYKDTYVARLTTPLPDTITPAKLLPPNYEDYLGNGKYLPSICVNENQQVVVGEIGELDDCVNEFSHYGMVASTNAVTELRERIRETISIGQSSSPVFFLIGDEPVLLLIKHWGYPSALQWNPTWGPSLPFFINDIQRIIDEWEGEGEYQLDVVDLSDFSELPR